jgi:UPF0042 nucleotide-binding protein
VRRFVLEKSQTVDFLAKFKELLDFLIPAFRREGKSYLTISLGCTGGRHRSVALVEELQHYLGSRNLTVKVSHRDMDKG